VLVLVLVLVLDWNASSAPRHACVPPDDTMDQHVFMAGYTKLSSTRTSTSTSTKNPRSAVVAPMRLNPNQ
jgi:hypothetical protein